MTIAASASNTRKSTNIIAWVLQVLLAAAFLAAASAELAGVPMLVQVFDQIGAGQWFRIVTAIVEIAGAIALLMPGFAALGALWLGTTMFFATLTHVVILHTSAAPAMVLFVLAAILAWLRRDQLWALRDKVLGAK